MENKIVVVVKGIILHNNKCLIIKRADNDEIGAGKWEFVGGKLEFGEDLEDSLAREVKEEAGLEISIDKLLYATTFYTDPFREVIVLVYKCFAADDIVRLSSEHSDYKWVSEEELRTLLDPGILRDMDRYGAFSSMGGLL